MSLVWEANDIAARVQFSDGLAELLDGTDKETTAVTKRKFGFQFFTVSNNLDSSKLQKILRAGGRSINRNRSQPLKLLLIFLIPYDTLIDSNEEHLEKLLVIVSTAGMSRNLKYSHFEKEYKIRLVVCGTLSRSMEILLKAFSIVRVPWDNSSLSRLEHSLNPVM